MASYKPNQGMKAEAARGLAWRKEHGRGGTRIGLARANQIVNGQNLSESTVKRMFSFFSRHEVDKQAEGFSPGEEGYPSNGRIAWALWGGDAGFSWSKKIVNKLKNDDRIKDMSDEVRHIKDIRETEDSYVVEFAKAMNHDEAERPGDHDEDKRPHKPYHEEEEERAHHDEDKGYHDDEKAHHDEEKAAHDEEEEERAGPDALEVGDFVSWRAGGGRAKGRITRISRDGAIKVPGTDFEINGEEDDPAALIRVYRGGEQSDDYAGHKFSALTKIQPIRNAETNENREAVEHFANQKHEREFEFDRNKIDEDKRTVSIGVSSELPVERNFGLEVLGHEDDEIDMEFMQSGRSPLLLDHDATKQIGVVEEFGIDKDNKRTIAKVRFSKNEQADEIFRDVRDGIRQNISVGYQVNSMKREDEEEDGVPVYRVNSWTPLEVSAVSIPADQSKLVGFARSKDTKIELTPSKTRKNMENNKNIAPEVSKEEMRKNLARENSEMLELGAQHNKRDLAHEAIREGLNLAQFKNKLLESIATDKPLDLPSDVDMKSEDKREYSLIKAIRESASNTLSGLEKEMSDEIAHKTGKAARGFYMPTNINFGKRDLTVGTNNAGGFLKGTDHLGNEFIEAVYAKLVVGEAGARVLQGLKGDVAIPKLSASVNNASFVAENAAPSESSQTFAQVTMSPKTLACHIDLSRKLMLQSDPSIEQIVRDDVINSFARKIDGVALEGGGSNEPTGLIGLMSNNVVSIGTNGGALSYANVVDLVKLVDEDNAIRNDGSVNFIGNAKVTAKLRTTSKQSSGVEGNFILEPNNQMLGFNYMSSSLVPSDLSKGSGSNLSALLFGDFSQLLIGYYSGVDVVVDPYTGSSAGTTRLAFFQDMDIAIRDENAFSVCKDIVTS